MRRRNLVAGLGRSDSLAWPKPIGMLLWRPHNQRSCNPSGEVGEIFEHMDEGAIHGVLSSLALTELLVHSAQSTPIAHCSFRKTLLCQS
ncbi:MAG: hypothetical protein ACRED0_06565 [Gammaproteobacteria bacterium]